MTAKTRNPSTRLVFRIPGDSLARDVLESITQLPDALLHVMAQEGMVPAGIFREALRAIAGAAQVALDPVFDRQIGQHHHIVSFPKYANYVEMWQNWLVTDQAEATRMRTALQQSDRCEFCLGTKGGMRGEELTVVGVVVCHECARLIIKMTRIQDAQKGTIAQSTEDRLNILERDLMRSS